jgi:hypothetical protein
LLSHIESQFSKFKPSEERRLVHVIKRDHFDSLRALFSNINFQHICKQAGDEVTLGIVLHTGYQKELVEVLVNGDKYH